jgi:hypothetical protein
MRTLDDLLPRYEMVIRALVEDTKLASENDAAKAHGE